MNVVVFQRLAAALLVSVAISPAALAQQSPAIPRPARLLDLDGRSALTALPSVPIAGSKGDDVARATEKARSVDPPRPPVDPQVLR